MGIGTNIKRLRLKQGLSRNALAEMSGVHLNSIRYYELGEGDPTVSKAIKLLDALGYELIIRPKN